MDPLENMLTTPVGPWSALDLVIAFVFILAGFVARAILNSAVIHRLEGQGVPRSIQEALIDTVVPGLRITLTGIEVPRNIEVGG